MKSWSRLAWMDALAAMAGARHLSADGSLAAVLFAYKLEKELIEVLAQEFESTISRRTQ